MYNFRQVEIPTSLALRFPVETLICFFGFICVPEREGFAPAKDAVQCEKSNKVKILANGVC